MDNFIQLKYSKWQHHRSSSFVFIIDHIINSSQFSHLSVVLCYSLHTPGLFASTECDFHIKAHAVTLYHVDNDGKLFVTQADMLPTRPSAPAVTVYVHLFSSGVYTADK